MRVLVTGAGGALGRRTIAALSRIPECQTTALLSPRSPGGVDVGDPVAFREAIRAARPDRVVHLAGVKGGYQSVPSDHTARINVGSARTLVAAGEELGVRRIVFASSAAVYGDHLTGPVDEMAYLSPTSDYARDKIAAEVELSQATTVETVCLRIFNVYGPGLVDSLVSRLVDSTIDHPVELRGLDEFVRDYVHVDDVVDALLSAVTADGLGEHSTFNIASGTSTSNRQLITALGPEKVHYFVSSPRSSFSGARIDAARDQLGYDPKRIIGISCV